MMNLSSIGSANKIESGHCHLVVSRLSYFKRNESSFFNQKKFFYSELIIFSYKVVLACIDILFNLKTAWDIRVTDAESMKSSLADTKSYFDELVDYREELGVQILIRITEIDLAISCHSTNEYDKEFFENNLNAVQEGSKYLVGGLF